MCVMQCTSRCRDPVTWRDSKESEDIHMPGNDVGGGWITGCGRHTHPSPPPECRAGGRTGRGCLQCCATGE